MEDKQSYNTGWNTSWDMHNVSKGNLLPLQSSFVYHSETELNSSSFWGHLTIYSGGGYVANLGNDKQHAIDLMFDLERTNWIDQYTRALFIEFNVWNANTNLFNLFILSLEFPPIGGMVNWHQIDSVQLYRYSGAGGVVNLLAEIACIIFVLVLTIFAIKDMIKQKCAYWTQFWNVLLVLSLLMFYMGFCFYVLRSLMTIKAVELMMNNRGLCMFRFI